MNHTKPQFSDLQNGHSLLGSPDRPEGHTSAGKSVTRAQMWECVHHAAMSPLSLKGYLPDEKLSPSLFIVTTRPFLIPFVSLGM